MNLDFLQFLKGPISLFTAAYLMEYSICKKESFIAGFDRLGSESLEIQVKTSENE